MEPEITHLYISEIFYSLQGEGGRAGEASLFVRLQSCKAKNACYASGVRCDTEFESGQPMSLLQIHSYLNALAPSCKWIVWTGGEPTMQLTSEIVEYFSSLGYKQAIETSGLNPVPEGLDYVCVSPKVAEHVIDKNFPDGYVHELRYVRHAGQSLPAPTLEAEYYYLSPHFDGAEINAENLRHCIHLCLQHPQWRLSVQQHKIWNIL
jgi:organic radical activating enzyme